MNLLQFFGKKTFPHGVHPPEFKELTSDKKIRCLPFAPKVALPLNQHYGKPAIPVVRKGQEVVRGEMIARADGGMSVPIHASVTGVVENICLMPSARGPRAQSVVIRTHPSSSQIPLEGTPRDIDAMTPQELIQAVQDTGMIGLGGGGFPTHIKLSVPEEHSVDTLLVNGCECEPYLTTDHRVMLENIENLLLGIRIAMKCIGAKRAVIGLEENTRDAMEAIRSRLPKDGSITVEMVKTKYPQGAEKMLTKALLDKEVPSGGYPSEIGVGVYNVATLAHLGELLPRGQGLIERVVTISGSDVKRPGNYLIPIGTPLRFALEQAGYMGEASRLILGGPMMGFTVPSLDVPLTKGVGGLLALEKRAQQSDEKIYPCIKCSLCLKACPIHLNPSQLGLLAAKREYQKMEKEYHLNDCFECGCCSYVCPSNIPLVQYFRIAKALNFERRMQ